MPARTSNFREDARYRIMSLLRDQPNLTQRQIAAALGLSLGGVNCCLRGLIEKGQVKFQNVLNAPEKIRYAYLLTPDGFAEKARLTARFLARRMREYEALKAEIELLEAEIVTNSTAGAGAL